MNTISQANAIPSRFPPPQSKIRILDLELRRITHKTQYPAPTPVVRIAGANYGLAGMISALTGPPKSGKTTVIGFILATAFRSFLDPLESLQIESSLAYDRDVVYMDFEQHVSSTQQLHDRVLQYAGLTESPENLHILNLLEYSMDDRNQFVDLVFSKLNPHLLVIDGLADILPSVNDEEKANALIEKLALLASKHNTCVVVVIHENKGGGTVRGHLGSQVERKCAGLISVRKDREKKEHSIESRLIRIGDDFENVYFHYCPEKKRMILLDALQMEQRREQAKQGKVGKNEDTEFLSGLIYHCFKDKNSLSKKELRAQIMRNDINANSEKTADRRIEGALTLNLLFNENNEYQPNHLKAL